MKTKADYLFSIESPWISVGSGEPERHNWIPSFYYSRDGIATCTRHLRGRKMRTTQGLMNEFAAAFQFFDGFGENWYALLDCLRYLDEWLPAEAYILDIEGAEEVLQDESTEQFIALLKTLHDAGEWWARPITDNGQFNRHAVPFHSLLNVSAGNKKAVAWICENGHKAKVPIRIAAAE